MKKKSRWGTCCGNAMPHVSRHGRDKGRVLGLLAAVEGSLVLVVPALSMPAPANFYLLAVLCRSVQEIAEMFHDLTALILDQARSRVCDITNITNISNITSTVVMA